MLEQLNCGSADWKHRLNFAAVHCPQGPHHVLLYFVGTGFDGGVRESHIFTPEFYIVQQCQNKAMGIFLKDRTMKNQNIYSYVYLIKIYIFYVYNT